MDDVHLHPTAVAHAHPAPIAPEQTRRAAALLALRAPRDDLIIVDGVDGVVAGVRVHLNLLVEAGELLLAEALEFGDAGRWTQAAEHGLVGSWLCRSLRL